MEQYHGIKQKYPEALLLFRVGDFYETFGSDAVEAAQILDIVLTKRANGSASHVELAGFPHHALNTYLPKLVRAGKKVAICDQLEDPSKTKKLVKRGVTEIVTPGMVTGDEILNAKSNNFILAIHPFSGSFGLALLDISTGEFWLGQGNESFLFNTVSGFQPREVLFEKNVQLPQLDIGSRSTLGDWAFSEDFAREKLKNHFGTQSLKGFGVQNLTLAIIAAGALFAYANETQHKLLQHIRSLKKLDADRHVWMDNFTLRNLEIVESNYREGKSLFETLNDTKTAMGSRLFYRWLCYVLKDLHAIKARQTAVEFFVNNHELTETVQDNFKQISDIERLTAKIATLRISPKQLIQLAESCVVGESIIENIQLTPNAKVLHNHLKNLKVKEIIQLVTDKLNEQAPHDIKKGNAIKQGVSEELDKLRDLKTNGQTHLKNLQEKYSNQYEIPSLKIGFNNVFGYYIEVRNTHKNKAPEEWNRKQTLVNAERYITPELKDYENQILSAQERIHELEEKLFTELLSQLIPFLGVLQEFSDQIARLDIYVCLALQAIRYNYVKPQITDGFDLELIEARHPVIERFMKPGEKYIANSLLINKSNQQILMITGPNMSGKSALLRQTALAVIMAQMGSFIPARSAKLGIIDRIFTRVGASDNLAAGESTFMVEMNETSNILHNLSARSLVLLDEIGRGTSTFDGISIAWAIAEYLHEHPHQPKTLFATHYHELNEMSDLFPRIKNFNVSIKELKDKILFVRKLVSGGSQHSFGIHVAKMAGIPSAVWKRAEEILETMEQSGMKEELKNKTRRLQEQKMQLSFFQLDDPLLEDLRTEINRLDINTLTPVEALMKLNEIKKKLG